MFKLILFVIFLTTSSCLTNHTATYDSRIQSTLTVVNSQLVPGVQIGDVLTCDTNFINTDGTKAPTSM